MKTGDKFPIKIEGIPVAEATVVAVRDTEVELEFAAHRVTMGRKSSLIEETDKDTQEPAKEVQFIGTTKEGHSIWQGSDGVLEFRTSKVPATGSAEELNNPAQPPVDNKVEVTATDSERVAVTSGGVSATVEPAPPTVEDENGNVPGWVDPGPEVEDVRVKE